MGSSDRHRDRSGEREGTSEGNREKEREKRDKDGDLRRERSSRSSHHRDRGDRERDRDKDKERQREKRTAKSSEHHHDDNGPERKPRPRKDSTSAVEIPSDVLREVASVTDGDAGRFKVISGAEARKYADKFIREQRSREILASDGDLKGKSEADGNAATNDKVIQRAMQPVVFALCRGRSRMEGTKENIVHWIKAWQGKDEGRTHPLRGGQRRANFLESEFKKVTKTLDDFRRRSIMRIDDDVEGRVTALKRAPTDPQAPPQLPPMIAKLAAREAGDAQVDGEGNDLLAPPASRSVSDPLPTSLFPPPSSFPINLERPPLGAHRGSVDSLNSVTSLPLLGMVRGVPVGNRVPLRVTNPSDRLSTLSSNSGSAIDAAISKLANSPLGPSPLSHGLTAHGETMDAHSTHLVQLPGIATSDTSKSSKSSRRSRRSEKRSDDDKEKEKLLIVLLDENDDANGLADGKGARRLSKASDEGASWHGLERRLSSRPGSRRPTPPTSSHPSPWLGPLLDLDEDVRYVLGRQEAAEDSDDYEDESAVGAPGRLVPVSSLVAQLHALGYGSTTPYGSYSSLPATSAYGGSPYAPSPQQLQFGGSPYAPSAQVSSPYRPSSYHSLQSPSRPRTPPYGTPGVTAYPPTNYVSPTPAGYSSPVQLHPHSSPYASPYGSPGPVPLPVPAPPLGGYAYGASPYASPALSTSQLAQAYAAASPYHVAAQLSRAPSTASAHAFYRG
ncbi:hypothetical protein MKEN_00050600 [Mycena kentingensis (nom. inval.)]|nr:hypothetical protein MKEN_00050600 [Mycena kentingensis (nom. inval.)]